MVCRSAEAGDDQFAVVCLYTIDGERGVVRCAAITTLRRPII